jgi:hypothetical protein
VTTFFTLIEETAPEEKTTVATFFLIQHTKNGGKYTERPQNIPDGNKNTKLL